uniref:Uncharacterized protein n=1 Tax=Heliothis virescens TaxID=7102 RepID=A0A2A4KA87_HELVI
MTESTDTPAAAAPEKTPTENGTTETPPEETPEKATEEKEKETPPPKEMRAVVLTGFGGLKTVKILKKPEPTVGEGEVLIRVKAWVPTKPVSVRTGPVHSPRLELTVASLTSASVEMHSSCIRPIEISARTLAPTTDVRRALKRIYTSATAVVDPERAEFVRKGVERLLTLFFVRFYRSTASDNAADESHQRATCNCDT